MDYRDTTVDISVIIFTNRVLSQVFMIYVIENSVLDILPRNLSNALTQCMCVIWL